MSDVSHQVSAASGTEDHRFLAGFHRNCLRIGSRTGVKKIDDRLPHLIAVVSIGHQIDVAGTMLENAALDDFGLGTGLGGNELPVAAAREEGFYSVRRAPVEIAVCVFTVSQHGSYGYDALAAIVG